MSPPSIRVDRGWLGAPSGTVGNPTTWLFAGAVALLAVGSWGYLAGALSVAVTIAVNAVGLYVIFTPLHEAMHGIAHESRWVNGAIGRCAGIPLTMPLPLFRAVHYEHHSHTNDARRDPDFVVGRRPAWLMPLWCIGVTTEYRLKFYGHRLWRTRGQLAEAIAVDVALIAIVAWAVARGAIGTLGVVWLVPGTLAVLFLAFAFDYLPHYPYDTGARWFDTRIYPGRTLNALLLGQNYHLIHHLWTTIPWYRYRRVFAETRADLGAGGCRIGWRVTPLPEGVSPLATR